MSGPQRPTQDKGKGKGKQTEIEDEVDESDEEDIEDEEQITLDKVMDPKLKSDLCHHSFPDLVTSSILT